MKKMIGILLILCLLCGSLPMASAAGGIVIDGTWSVLLPEAPTAYEAYAAETLRRGLTEALGVEIPAVSAAENRYIAVGSASRADVSEVADNGYRITALDGNIHIAGTAQRGLQAGAYRFLEEYCNRKIYTQDIIVCPKNDRITVPADADVIYEPFFEYTDTDWNSPRNAEYSMANGLNGGQYRTLGPEMGDTVNYIGGFCHTMGWLCETWKYAETHPEYLALHDGVRTTDQPCLTNPEVLRICTENVLNLLAEKHDPSAPLQIVSVTQNDNYSCCECDACAAFEAQHGGKHSATVLNFVNQVADAVKAAGYENVAIDTFAYLYSQAAPENIVPRDNVIVRLCSIFCCFSHPFDAKCNKEFMQDLSDWSKICNRLYVWDYATNYSHTVAVFPNFNVIQKNMQILYEHNVKGVYVEGNYYIDKCDTEFAELRAYMISKCLQDPYCDLDKEVDGFLQAYYGPGGKLVGKILDIYCAHAGSFDGTLWIYYGSWACMRPMPAMTVKLVDSLWCLAKKDAEGKCLANLERSELSWRWWKASAAMGEFSYLSPCRGDEKEKLFEDLKNAGVTMLHEGRIEDYATFDRDLIRYAMPDEWSIDDRNADHVQKRIQIEKLIEKIPLFAPIGYIFNLIHS